MIEPCTTCKNNPEPHKITDLWRIECCEFQATHGLFTGVIMAWNSIVKKTVVAMPSGDWLYPGKTTEIPWK